MLTAFSLFSIYLDCCSFLFKLLKGSADDREKKLVTAVVAHTHNLPFQCVLHTVRRGRSVV